MINKILDFIKEAEIDDITFYNDDFTQSVIVTMSKGLKKYQEIFPYDIICRSTDQELKFYLLRCADHLKRQMNNEEDSEKLKRITNPFRG